MSGIKQTRGAIVAALLTLVAVLGCATMDLVKVEVMLSQEKYPEAITILEEYLKKTPNSADAMSRLGYAYLKTGQTAESFAILEKARQIDADHPFAVYYLGLAHLSKGEYDQTVALWRNYKDEQRPLVAAEIRRLNTLIHISASHQAAKTAIAAEKQLQTGKADPATVAVCYYQDMSASRGMAGFQKGLAAMLITDLGKIQALKVVERLRLQALLEEMQLGMTGIVDAQTAPRVGRLLGAETLVVGTLNEEILVTSSLASSSAGKVKGSTAATVPQASFFEIPGSIVNETAKIMGITLTDAERRSIGTIHTKKFQAVVFYGEALDALDGGMWLKAKEMFALTLREDPQFLLAKEGFDRCPEETAPSISQLAAMGSGDLLAMAEAGYQKAVVAQARRDRDSAMTTSETDGGGGGGGGGGGH